MNYRTEYLIAWIVLSIFLTTIWIWIWYFYAIHWLEPWLIIHIIFFMVAFSINTGVLFILKDK